MQKLFPLAVSAIFLAVALCSTSQAEIVIDDFGTFGDGTLGNGVVVTTNSFLSNNGSAYTLAAGLGGSTNGFVNYDFGGTLEALAGDPYVEVLTVPVDFNVPEAWTMTIREGDGGTIFYSGSPTELVQNAGFVSATQLRFEFVYIGTDPALFAPEKFGDFGGGSLLANPEPSTALMFSSILGLVGLRRRRRA